MIPQNGKTYIVRLPKTITIHGRRSREWLVRCDRVSDCGTMFTTKSQNTRLEFLPVACILRTAIACEFCGGVEVTEEQPNCPECLPVLLRQSLVAWTYGKEELPEIQAELKLSDAQIKRIADGLSRNATQRRVREFVEQEFAK